MTEVTSLLSPIGESNILAVQAFKGLHLEPPTKDVVSITFIFKIKLVAFSINFTHRRKKKLKIFLLQL